jgi:hypothetical protein
VAAAAAGEAPAAAVEEHRPRAAIHRKPRSDGHGGGRGGGHGGGYGGSYGGGYGDGSKDLAGHVAARSGRRTKDIVAERSAKATRVDGLAEAAEVAQAAEAVEAAPRRRQQR